MATRILHVVDTWAVGGLQNGLTNLMERMDQDQFENVVCAMRPVSCGNALPAPSGRSTVISLSSAEAGRRFQAPALARKIREVKPDIVHTRNWGTFEALLAARWTGGCSLVHSEHGIDWDTAKQESWRRVLSRRIAFQAADRVVAVSHQLRELHAARTGFGKHKIRVIHNGVDSRRFSPDGAARNRVRRELGISEDEFCIGCVGNLIPVKDHLTLLRAIEDFARQSAKWRLLIVGAGPELLALQGFVNEHAEWKEKVTFLGRSNSIAELLNGLDVYVLSSLTEGISNSLLEAMATGLPVIATDTGGNPEVIVDGDCGHLFPVGDHAGLAGHLRALETRSDWRRQLGQRSVCRARAEFSIDSMVRQYQELYESFEAAPAPVGAVTGI